MSYKIMNFLIKYMDQKITLHCFAGDAQSLAILLLGQYLKANLKSKDSMQRLLFFCQHVSRRVEPKATQH